MASPSFSSKSPTIKRILREASELASSPSSDYAAAPLETDLFEWHFTLRGPPSPSPFEGGLYHGRIVLPPAYPLKPPSFRFLTPTGRFEVNREICLSISGHHEESWQPAWGIRTALVAIRSFMDTDAKGQLGGMESSEGVRRRFAEGSGAWRCGSCGKTNVEIMEGQDEAVRLVRGEVKKEVVPEELRLGYREDLGKGVEAGKNNESAAPAALVAPPAAPYAGAAPTPAPASDSRAAQPTIPQAAANTALQQAQAARPVP
ncbi:hypothetical protein B0A48_16602 [Cryoendolithus antarcticus]|uniref:UBC core domain-containing protein n=1 Tax=Cryoendolithus antarcticus TaxID=1507870 RepID=A0A1V8SEC5_9PEZI|nr:hypothetical protein B0A48_16602 [Cryoendolithus antarcticus]